MLLRDGGSRVLVRVAERVSEGPEVFRHYLRLSTHHQLTQSIVDELILSLRENVKI